MTLSKLDLKNKKELLNYIYELTTRLDNMPMESKKAEYKK
jgi:hypothetical protein